MFERVLTVEREFDKNVSREREIAGREKKRGLVVGDDGVILRLFCLFFMLEISVNPSKTPFFLSVFSFT